MGKYYVFVLLFFFALLNSEAVSQTNDCSGAITVCGNGDLNLLPSGSGADDFADPDNIPPSCQFFESKSLWLFIKIKSAGSLGFIITPENNNCPNGLCDDYDFAVYGPNATCGNLGASIRCQSTHPPSAGVGGETGMIQGGPGTSDGPGAAGNGFVRWLDNVNAGETYFILIDNFDERAGFSLTWSGTALLEDRITKAEGGVDLGNDITECENIPVTLTATQPDGGTYLWQDGSVGDTFIVPAGISGTYSVEVVNSSGCRSMDEVEVDFIPIPIANDTEDNKCESTPGSNMATFTLSDYNTAVSGGATSVTISYHDNQNDAENNLAPLNNVVTTPTRTVFVRIKDDLSACFGIAELLLIVDDGPTVNNAVLPIVTCSVVPNANIDLSLSNNDVSGGATGVVVTYHLTATEAQAGTGVLTIPYNTASVILHTRVTDVTNGCFNTGTLQVLVLQEPEVWPQTQDLCSDTDMASFDIGSLRTAIINGAINVTVTFHETMVDGNSGTSPLSDTYTTTSTTIYARSMATYENNSCHVLSPVILTVNPNPVAIDTAVFTCSETEVGIFDLNAEKDNITGGVTNRKVTFFASMDDVTNSIPLTEPYSLVSSDIIARVENILTKCFSFASVALTVHPNPDFEETISIEECFINNVATFNLLAELNRLEIQRPEIDFSFHATKTDAETNINPLPDEIASLDRTIFTRIAFRTTGCFIVKSAQLITIPTPVEEIIAYFCKGDGYTLPSGIFTDVPGIYSEGFNDPITDCDFTIITDLRLGEIEFVSAFSPNGNGQNDRFGALPGEECVGFVTNYLLQVYNRWGEKVFETNDFMKRWDGQFNGYAAQAGLYLWYTEYTFQDEEFKREGTVALLR